MIINTCSEAISLAKELEINSLKFYMQLAEKFSKGKDLFFSFTKENEDFIVQIERAYYGVISDAIEGCFAFNLNPDLYKAKMDIQKIDCYSDAIKKAIEIEEKILKFYIDAAEQSKSLMADVPRSFKLVAKKRERRLFTLKSLINS